MGSNRKERRAAAASGRRTGEATPPVPGSVAAREFERALGLREAGLLGEAEGCLRTALVREPDQPRILNELGLVLRLRHEPSKAAQILRRALRAAPRSAEILANLGATLRDLGEEEDALRAFQRSAEMKPDFLAVLAEIGVSQQALGRVDAAIVAFEQALEKEPRQPRVLADLGLACLEAGDPGRALEVSESCLALQPTSLVAMLVRAHASDELGQAHVADALLDLERLVVTHDLEQVPGFPSVEDFNEVLRDHVSSHSSLQHEPNQRTTVGGLQTGDLNVEPRGPIAALEALMQEHVQLYLDQQGSDPGHPFLAQRPRSFHLNLWATLLDSAGHQAPHIHPAAWVSAVYYVQVPDCVRADDAEAEGWIEFGRPSERLRLQAPPRTRRLMPIEGRLVLFPSYLYHRTMPFESDTRRISIAMDALPRW